MNKVTDYRFYSGDKQEVVQFDGKNYALKNKNNLIVTFSEVEKRDECSVSGTLALTFRLSQLFAVAPLKFGRRRGERFARVSQTMCIVIYLAMTFLNASCLAGLLLDLTAPPEKTIRTPPATTTKILWVTDFTLVMMIASIAAYGSPARFRATIRCLNRVHKIKNALSSEHTRISVRAERKKYMVFILFLSFTTVIVISEYGRCIDEVLYYKKSLVTLTLYLSYDVAYIMLCLLELQFAYITVEVCEVLRALNNALERILSPNSLAIYSVINPSKTGKETVHQLMSTFAIVFDVIKQLDKTNGPTLGVVLVSCLLHLVITPNCFIFTLSKDVIIAQRLVLDFLWCLFHFLRTVLLIEPPHMTMTETERTNQIVSYLMMQSTDDAVTEELNKFSKYLLLNRTAYSPMGVCSLTRSLLPAIIGTVATYLVIIVQFQEFE